MRSKASGFAYLFLLFVIALLAISVLAIGSLEHAARLRSNEAELLRIGGEFRQALAGYRDAASPKTYPASLDDLLSDRRGGIERRHLRKLYFDPMTGTRDWGLLLAQGRIVGVYSLSERQPLKIAGFDPADEAATGAEHYSQWVFSPEPTPPAAPTFHSP
jgi:type II secretory pathway pseudopilin PulG